MRMASIVLISAALAGCSATSSQSNVTTPASMHEQASINGKSGHKASSVDPCQEAVQSQQGAAIMGAMLGAVADYAPYSSRNGWAVNRAAYAGQRVVGTAEAVSAQEAGRKC